jgi:hypothetical protein
MDWDEEDSRSLPLFTTLEEHGHNIRELEIEGSVIDRDQCLRSEILQFLLKFVVKNPANFAFAQLL